MKINNASISAIFNRNFNKNDVAILINKGVIEQELVPLILNLITTRTRLQNLLRLYTYENSTLYLINLDQVSLLQLSFGKEVKEEDLVSGFEKVKNLAEDVFRENIMTYELAFSGIVERRIKGLPISMPSLNNPKIMGFRIISGLQDSSDDIRYKDLLEIILEPVVNNLNQTFVSVTYRDKSLNQDRISSTFKDVEDIINYLCE
ncbi:hypothetical protein [Sulfurisphaera ohwakuensis]|uniref:Uncharacterized protein n=1 Tax=Sulfurisphaera ohwakuensis TaxID=69656 RepID=A0A650CFW9_SULOH|nr:hypothetical protein [Sulfurisphaera ohwakuensis]MBB5254497.1 hypothetical protein [Sulfurisphaera ohwakuensis]QGR16702.1 hypothetical protein D1869_05505 [Sulfurisphaera ohwakuensis]